MKKIRLSAAALAAILFVPALARAQFASSVISYNPGTGFAASFTNASAALGAPASGGSVTPFAPPFSSSQIVSIGAGGSIALQLNTPIINNPSAPFGIDLNIFANEFFTRSSAGTVSGSFFHSAAATVQVSADGSTWFTLNPSLAPQPGALFPTDGSGNPLIPVNPALTLNDFIGQNLAGIRALYGGSAGGAGYSLAWAQDADGNSVALPSADFLRIEVASGVVDLDAVSVVPEPAILNLLLLAAIIFGVKWLRSSAQKWKSLQSSFISWKTIPLLFCVAASLARAGTFTENFATNPLQNGWQVFGDTNLFSWDPVNHDLAVTWDSSQPNSYFYRPLGDVLTKSDDFQVSFDLTISNLTAGVNTNKPDALEVGIGFASFGVITNAGFVRAVNPTNLVEFDYFPAFVDPEFGPFDASISPTIVSDSGGFYGAFGDFFSMTNGVTYHVQTVYTAVSGTLVSTVMLPGSTNVLSTAITSPSIPDSDDFQADTLFIFSYTDNGDSFDSLFGQGTVANVAITTPSPVGNLALANSNGVWQVQFTSRSNWLYTLQSAADLHSWQTASAPAPGNGTTLILQDTNLPAADHNFYRVSALHP